MDVSLSRGWNESGITPVIGKSRSLLFVVISLLLHFALVYYIPVFFVSTLHCRCRRPPSHHSKTMTMKRSVQVGSLVAILSSCLLLASIRTTRHASIITNEGTQLQQNDQSSSLRRLVHPQQPIMTRRRLEEQNVDKAPSRLTEEEKKQRIRAFLGGIYPHLDANLVPKYLRDSLPREKLSVMDVWELDSDIAFFWHIPKVRIYSLF